MMKPNKNLATTCCVLALFFSAASWAQTKDEQLLAAQMHFQQAKDAAAAADAELKRAYDAQKLAADRVLSAQQILDNANEQLRAANQNKTSRDLELQKAIQQLDEIWLLRQQTL